MSTLIALEAYRATGNVKMAQLVVTLPDPHSPITISAVRSWHLTEDGVLVIELTVDDLE